MEEEKTHETLSNGWRIGVVVTILVGFTLLIFISAKAYREAPPVPERVIGPLGEFVFTGQDILDGQEIFLRYGLMENGTIWGHGAYLGPDFSAEYLHVLALHAAETVAQERFHRSLEDLSPWERESVHGEIRQMLKKNRYAPETKTLRYTAAEAASYHKQIDRWAVYFSDPARSGGLKTSYIDDPRELRKLAAFFAWTAWAAAANRPGKSYSYTNNFPYDPLAGNEPTADAFLWSALSLVTLLAGTALILFVFGRFNYLGWKRGAATLSPEMFPGVATGSQRATLKYFVVVALLFLAQVLVGGAAAHNRAEPGSFYGISV